MFCSVAGLVFVAVSSTQAVPGIMCWLSAVLVRKYQRCVWFWGGTTCRNSSSSTVVTEQDVWTSFRTFVMGDLFVLVKGVVRRCICCCTSFPSNKFPHFPWYENLPFFLLIVRVLGCCTMYLDCSSILRVCAVFYLFVSRVGGCRAPEGRALQEVQRQDPGAPLHGQEDTRRS